MALETRNGRIYFYKKYRMDGRVKSEYIASGDLAFMWQRGDEEDRAEAREEAAAKRAAWDALRSAIEATDDVVAASLGAIERAVNTAIEAAGYHRHRRELRWRKGGPKP